MENFLFVSILIVPVTVLLIVFIVRNSRDPHVWVMSGICTFSFICIYYLIYKRNQTEADEVARMAAAPLKQAIHLGTDVIIHTIRQCLMYIFG